PEQEAKLAALFQEERQRPFDLAHGPLLRASLLAFSLHRHVMLLSLPALCADAWTLKNLVQEISQAYATGAQHAAPSDAPLQYVQFSEWQHELLDEADAEAGKAYWRQHHSAAVPALPFARQPAGDTGFAPDAVAVELDREVVAQLDTVAARYHTSA